MKKVLFAILFMVPALALAEKPKPNPANYTVAVHVQSSRLILECGQGTCVSTQHLTVLIDGKRYELEDSGAHWDLLRVGDYKAIIAKDETTRTYEYARTYEFLFRMERRVSMS